MNPIKTTTDYVDPKIEPNETKIQKQEKPNEPN